MFLKLASPGDIKEWSFGESHEAGDHQLPEHSEAKKTVSLTNAFSVPTATMNVTAGNTVVSVTRASSVKKCGVELTRSIVRRERMGHIELSTPYPIFGFSGACRRVSASSSRYV